ncbi:sigma-70 family RNA polymerase sigma factor [Nonomuraea sp. SBT364]|uniref:sigma-70 family RNA polymerase sigma factor n=1 Tax=Nonomuraea sp. SBT364 TaxID=1580530 RepID=UPI00066D2BDB|nr:sigma-70 family RNA polymerase sigma factor [Nonomuraea sp. SBT364]
MTHSLTGQHSRPELIAELYDRHAAGLFAYCADQLGDPGSAADVLATVLAGVPSQPPPRAALYAYARREIFRRDVVYAPPVVDPLIDPASALVERTLRELRPQQREVLVLCQVCGLNREELAWVLDVAPDTAEELAVSVAHRFTQALGLALAGTGGRVSKPVADVYGALSVAPLRDVLGRLPWPTPPAALRVHFAGSRTAEPAPMFVKPRWPVPPTWPLPLGQADPASTTGIFPAELLTPPSPSRVPDHDATTAPMPKLRDPLAPSPERTGRPSSFRAFEAAPATPFAAFEPRRRAAADTPAPPPAPAPARDPEPRLERPFIMPAPVPADVLDDEPVTQELPAVGDIRSLRDPGPLFTPRTQAKEPVYRMPLPPEPSPVPASREAPEAALPDGDVTGPADAPEKTLLRTETSGTDALAASVPEARTRPARQTPAPRKAPGPRKAGARPKGKAGKKRRRHHDWAWEVTGFLICVVIAMIVFFSVPMIVSP